MQSEIAPSFNGDANIMNIIWFDIDQVYPNYFVHCKNKCQVSPLNWHTGDFMTTSVSSHYW